MELLQAYIQEDQVIKKTFFITVFFCIGFAEPSLQASELMKDFNSLGENFDLYKKIKKLNTEIKTQVIQKRIVDRRIRLEVLPTYITYWGGNPYVSSQSTGMEASFHLTPRWSLDLSYHFLFSNNLTSEGKFLIDNDIVPDVDFPKSSIIGFLTYYPFYGKLNLLDYVVHFDIYTSLGLGSSQLRYGNQVTVGTNLGMGIWWSQHLTTRIGYRYQSYEAQLKSGIDRLDMSSGFISVGYLL